MPAVVEKEIKLLPGQASLLTDFDSSILAAGRLKGQYKGEDRW